MLSIVNVWPIFKKHFETLKEDTSVIVIILLFIIGPLLGSILLVRFDFLITPNIANSLIATFSILVGFSINILIVLLGTRKMKTNIENKLIEHLSYNILYELIMGLLILFLSLASLIISSKISVSYVYILSIIIYFMVFNFLITLLMISKRIYALVYVKLKNK